MEYPETQYAGFRKKFLVDNITVLLQITSISTATTALNLRLHSKAGGGLNICHSGLGQTSQFVGMWYDICTNSWPFSPIVPGLSSRRVDNSNWDRLPSSGLLASPSPAYRSCKILPLTKSHCNVLEKRTWSCSVQCFGKRNLFAKCQNSFSFCTPPSISSCWTIHRLWRLISTTMMQKNTKGNGTNFTADMLIQVEWMQSFTHS